MALMRSGLQALDLFYKAEWETTTVIMRKLIRYLRRDLGWPGKSMEHNLFERH